MYGSTGSFAKGFVQAFLAAQRLAMEERHWKLIDENQRLINQQLLHGSPATQAFNTGEAGYRNHTPAKGSSGGAEPGKGEIETYIRERAPQFGIDPDRAMKVANGEGGVEKGNLPGDGNSSFGPFQLHYGNVNPKMPSPGLGDAFTQATGLNARDPSTWKAQVDFALQHAATHGWGDWFGGRDKDWTPWVGIDRNVDPSKFPKPGEVAGEPLKLQGAAATPDGKPTFSRDTEKDYTTSKASSDSTPGVPDTYTEHPIPGKSYRPSLVPPGTVFGQAAPEAGGAPIGAPPPTSTSDVLRDNAEGNAKQGWTSDANNMGPSPLGLPIPTNNSGADAGQQALPLGADPYAYAPMDEPMSLPWGDDYYSARGGLVPRVKRYALGGLVDDEQDQTDDSEATPPVADATMGGNEGALPISDASFNSPMSRLQSQARSQVRVPMPGYGAGGSGASTMGGGRSMHMGRSPSLRGVDQGPVPEGFGVTVPQFTDGEGGASDGLAGAIQGGISFLAKLVGGGALPNDQQQGQGRQAFHGGASSMSPEQIEQVSRAANSDGGLDSHMAHAAGLQMMHEFYLARGDERSANAATGAMLKGLQEQASKLAAKSIDQYTRGDYEGAARALENAYGYVPDLHSIDIKPQKDGYAIVTQRDAQGKVTKQLELAPQQLLGAAVGLKNGQLFWAALNDEVAPKAKGQFSPEDQKAFAEITGGGNGGAPSQPKTAQAPTAAPGQPPASPASAQEGALPLAPADTPAPEASAAPEAAQPEPASAQAPAPAATPQGAGAIPLATQPGAIQHDMELRNEAYFNYGVQLHPPAQFVATPRNFANMTPQGQNALRQWQKTQLMEWNKENNARRSAAEKYVTDQILQSRQAKSNENIADRQQTGETARLMMNDRLQRQRDEASAARQDKSEQFKSGQALQLETDKNDMPIDLTKEGTQTAAFTGSDGDAYTHASKLLPAAIQNYAQRFDPEQRDALAQHAVDIMRYTKTLPADAVVKVMGKIISPEFTGKQQQQDREAFDTEYNPRLKAFRLTMPSGQRVVVPLDTMNALLDLRAQQKSAYTDRALTIESNASQRDQDYAKGRALTKRILERADQPQAIPLGGW